MNTLQEKWQTYERLLSPKRNKENEKIAFYCGAIAALELMLYASEMEEEVGALLLEGVYDECTDFIKQQENVTIRRTGLENIPESSKLGGMGVPDEKKK